MRHARPGQTLVLTSTTYVGTTRELLAEPLAERGLRVGEDVFVAFAPERIDPGVGGARAAEDPAGARGREQSASERAAAVLRHTCKRLHRVSSPEAAEMVKLYENTFRAVNIALAFELAEACGTHGLDPVEVTEGAATKPYGFMAHYPSAGVGGHCIAVDPYYLLHDLRERGRPATMAEEALRKVAGRPRHIAWRAHEMLVELGRPLPQARVLVVGASYKPGVADTREAPGAGDHRAPARRGRPRRLPRPARARARGATTGYDRRGRAGRRTPTAASTPRVRTRGLRPRDPRDVHPEHDYGWLDRCPAVLDCTYRTPGGRRRPA